MMLAWNFNIEFTLKNLSFCYVSIRGNCRSSHLNLFILIYRNNILYSHVQSFLYTCCRRFLILTCVCRSYFDDEILSLNCIMCNVVSTSFATSVWFWGASDRGSDITNSTGSGFTCSHILLSHLDCFRTSSAELCSETSVDCWASSSWSDEVIRFA